MLIPKIRNYLKKDLYNINLTPNNIYINNYINVNSITETLISIVFKEFILNINGTDFKIAKILDNEILFNGQIESMEYIYNQ